MKTENNQGYVAFSSLLVISAVALAIAVSLSAISITNIQSSFSRVQGEEAYAIAQGCANEALLRLRDSSSYTGSTLSLGDGTCTISITATPPNHIIEIGSTINLPPIYTQHLQLIVRRIGHSINVLSWEKI